MKTLKGQWLLFAFAALASGCATPTSRVPARSGPLTGDEQRLQGAWVVVHNEIMGAPTPQLHGRVHFYEGRRFHLDTDSGSEEFRVDEQSNPKRIDFDDGRLPLIQGIYKLEGDRLTVCTNSPGRPRPEAFATAPGSRIILTILNRQPPR
jgi:uncharacterized protein (TIGR03067 family)